MFALLSGAYEAWSKKRIYNVLILGLDGAGKTTLLEQIKRHQHHTATTEEESISTIPTIGMNLAVVEAYNVNIKFWDLGGNEKLCSIWQNYYAESDGIIFVVDGLDWERMEKVRDSFTNVASHDALEGVPVLVVVNKLDLQGEQKEDIVAKVKEVFNPIMPTIGARESKVAGCSALKGYPCELSKGPGSPLYLEVELMRSRYG